LPYGAYHVLTGLYQHFDQILTWPEYVSGRIKANVKSPVMILGSLDGIETGIRQLIRSEPSETAIYEDSGLRVTVPAEAGILRIKPILILKRNATSGFPGFAALSDRSGHGKTADSLRSFDRLWPQPDSQSALQRLLARISNPLKTRPPLFSIQRAGRTGHPQASRAFSFKTAIAPLIP
jgi:hypothetical protein